MGSSQNVDETKPKSESKSEDTSFIHKLGQIPCARTSLLSGIAGGLGFGVIRGLNSSRIVAFHWTMGSFLVISMGIWTICRTRIRDEHKRMEVLVESLPKLRRRKPEELQRGN